MLLVIDIGNTQATLGIWDGTAWRIQFRLQSSPHRTADEYGSYLRTLLRDAGLLDDIDRVALASVVPALTRTFRETCRHYLGLDPLSVTADLTLGIRILTDNPREVGADRIANAVAAHHFYPGPAIALDMGTATTLDVVSRRGELLGVVIATGLATSAEALSGRAAQLSRVALEAPATVIGRNTIHAMQSGIIFGYAAMVEGLVRRLRREMEEPDARVIGTGGLIHAIAGETEIIDVVDPWLTLNGIRLIAEMNDS
jgi:type III pantothenate kinase